MHNKKLNNYIKQTLSIIFTIMLAFAFRSFIFEPFRIPSGSMKGNLLIGDFLIVSKYSYGYSKYCLPFNIPIIKNHIFYKQPKRGDVVVFKPPSTPNTHFIKRIIGLPGDTMQIINSVPYINEKAVLHKQIDDFEEYDQFISQFEETLPNNKKYTILKDQSINNSIFNKINNTKKYIIPEDHFMMLGDNRDHSRDSRFEDIGFIPKENLVGKARIIVFSWSDIKNQYIRPNRIFKFIY